MLLAELNVRHTRRYMPTRRVALDGAYLPTSGPAYGGVLLGAVIVEHMGWLDEEQEEMFTKLLREARDGLDVPRIAMRYRLQTDTHGLDRSRHRIMGEELPGGGRQVVLELDCHGRSAPQVIGAVMAVATLRPTARQVALRAIDGALRSGGLPEGFVVRRLLEGVPGLAPFAPGARPVATKGDDPWRGVPSERRWAMEVLGLKAEMVIVESDVQARFRRLARLAHPDHGASPDGAAERLAELSEARALLLGLEPVASATRN
ncbi:MAG: J domain-containing protein [Actinobacteria bacterium]|nr:J domain-containing protein [Actinomycetota bacterium]